MDLLCGKGIRRFATIYYSSPPPLDAKSTILTKKTRSVFERSMSSTIICLCLGDFSSFSFSHFHQGATASGAAVLCIKAQKIMVYLLVNTSIKVCSFLFSFHCRFFFQFSDFPSLFFNFLLTFFLTRLLWRFFARIFCLD